MSTHFNTGSEKHHASDPSQWPFRIPPTISATSDRQRVKGLWSLPMFDVSTFPHFREDRAAVLGNLLTTPSRRPHPAPEIIGIARLSQSTSRVFSIPHGVDDPIPFGRAGRRGASDGEDNWTLFFFGVDN